MAYNSNDTTKAPYVKPTTTVVVEAPAAKVEDAKRKPDASLHIQKAGEETKQRLTGLFKDISKSGVTYLRGSMENGDKFIIFLNDK